MNTILPTNNNETPTPRRKLLILDLDETLMHAAEAPLSRPCDFRVGRFYAYKRPYVEAFVAGCLRLFEVAVWTSAAPDYARGVVAALFPDPSQLVFLWASDRCTERFHPETYERYGRKPIAKLRRLRRTWGWGLGDILAVDDSPEKWEASYGNFIRVTPFTGDPEDAELLRLLAYLTAISKTPNFRALEKRAWCSHRPTV